MPDRKVQVQSRASVTLRVLGFGLGWGLLGSVLAAGAGYALGTRTLAAALDGLTWGTWALLGVALLLTFGLGTGQFNERSYGAIYSRATEVQEKPLPWNAVLISWLASACCAAVLLVARVFLAT